MTDSIHETAPCGASIPHYYPGAKLEISNKWAVPKHYTKVRHDIIRVAQEAFPKLLDSIMFCRIPWSNNESEVKVTLTWNRNTLFSGDYDKRHVLYMITNVLKIVKENGCKIHSKHNFYGEYCFRMYKELSFIDEIKRLFGKKFDMRV